MATWDDVRRLALSLPEVGEGPKPNEWRVRGRLLAWERPLRTKDVAELGERAPDGDVLAVSLPDEGAKHALVASEPGVYFTTSHFDGYPAVLVELDRASVDDLRELLGEAWAARAPKRLVQQTGG